MAGDDICVAEVRDWADGLEEVRELIGPRFARTEPWENAVASLRGLLSGAERKNSWTLSEQAGQAVRDRMQRLLSSTEWDPDSVRDDLRSYVVKHLGTADGVLIVDETGFLKIRNPFGRGGQAVLGNGGADRELPDRRVPDLLDGGGADLPGPGAVPAQ